MVRTDRRIMNTFVIGKYTRLDINWMDYFWWTLILNNCRQLICMAIVTLYACLKIYSFRCFLYHLPSSYWALYVHYCGLECYLQPFKLIYIVARSSENMYSRLPLITSPFKNAICLAIMQILHTRTSIQITISTFYSIHHSTTQLESWFVWSDTWFTIRISGNPLGDSI